MWLPQDSIRRLVHTRYNSAKEVVWWRCVESHQDWRKEWRLAVTKTIHKWDVSEACDQSIDLEIIDTDIALIATRYQNRVHAFGKALGKQCLVVRGEREQFVLPSNLLSGCYWNRNEKECWLCISSNIPQCP